MCRLYDLSYNQNQWCILGSQHAGYRIVNQKNSDSYYVGEDIIGIEQIFDDEFLIFRRAEDDLQIVRYKFDTNIHKVQQLYCKTFYDFEFLTEDTIIFDKDSRESLATLYHISSNTEDDALNQILGFELDYRLIEKQSICLLHDDVAGSEYPTALFVEYKFNSYPLDICAYLQVVLDTHTLAPISPAYSSLRNKYFYFDESVTLRQIAKEDSYYASVIGHFLSKFYSEGTTKTPTDLLNMAKVN